MTDIYCSAVQCAHNKENCCCLGNVHVGGKNAESSDCTCCDSFIKQHATMQIGESVCHCSCIDCDAGECRYNCDGECCADTVNIKGDNSCRCDETCCCTFKK